MSADRPVLLDRGKKRGRAADPERAEREAARRAVSRLRRVCVQQKCDRLGSLTFRADALPADRAGVWEQIARFRREMAVLVPGLVMVFVIEGDPGVELGGEDGKRLHVHFAFDRYVPRGVFERAWGLGFVDVRRIQVAEGQRFGEVGKGKRAGARRAAAYLAKYVGKGFEGGDGGRQFNGKRYSVPKGCTVRRVQVRTSDLVEALTWVQAQTGGAVVGSWSSAGIEDWAGPPCWVWEFGDP